MSVIKSKMATIAVCYTNILIQSLYFTNSITGTYFNLNKSIIPLELASARPFFHINTYQFKNVCHLKAMLKAMYFKNKHGDPYFYLLF